MTDSVSRSVVTEAVRERAELARELRELLGDFTGAQAADDVLSQVRDHVQAAQRLLRDEPFERGLTRVLEGELTGLGPYGELGPFTGRLHAIGAEQAEITSRAVDGGHHVEGRMRFGPAHQGAPGLLHGGVITAVFDEVLGLAQAGSGRMTATLQVDFLAPTPLGADLRFTAGVASVEGRKARVRGEVTHQSVTCARAEALFIAPRRPDEGGSPSR